MAVNAIEKAGFQWADDWPCGSFARPFFAEDDIVGIMGICYCFYIPFHFVQILVGNGSNEQL